MRFRLFFSMFVLAAIAGCSNHGSTGAASSTRSYNATASVGDFLTITINPAALTLTYNDVTNGASGTVPYTVNSDGSYALSDPSGNLLAAYEIPNYAMVIESMKSGPSANTPALITAVESGPITLATFEGNDYNYMQFRTNFGGLAIGSIDIGSSAGQTSEYWPYGAISNDGNQPFSQNSIPLSIFTEDASGDYLSGAMPNGGGAVTLFGTAGGFFVVDTGNGSIFGLPKASAAGFSSANAGAYTALVYQKKNVQMSNSTNSETGTESFVEATITITAQGGFTMTGPSGNTISTGTLTPVANAGYLYNNSGTELTDPCWGMFTYRVTTGSSQSDMFVTFVNGAVVFSSFEAPLPWNGNLSYYNYMYGVGLN